MKKCLLIITSIILCTVTLLGCADKEVEMTEESKKYLAAVEEMVGFYEENPYMLYNCKEEDWTTSLNKLKEEIRENKVNEDEIYYRMQELSAVLNNGHTSVVNLKSKNEKMLPIKGDYYGDNFYIVYTNSENRELLGDEIIAINDIKFEDIEERFSKIISAENNQWVRSRISNNLLTESLLKYLNIWKDENVLKVKTLDGNTKDVSIDSIMIEELSDITIDPNNSFGYNKNSIENSKPEGAYDAYWFTLDKDNRILYFQYNTCLAKNDKKLSANANYSSLPVFDDFQKSFTKFANDNKDNFDKIVVDVSHNTGGYREHLDNLIEGNLKIFKSKKVYAIMSKGTFSAGVFAVDSLVDKCNATMVGEETGGSIEMFGLFETKSSSILPMEYSIGDDKFNILDKAGKNTDDNMRGAIPDIKVEYTIDDVKNGINPYYKAVIEN